MKRTTTRRGFAHPENTCLVWGFLLSSTIFVALPLVRVARHAGWNWWCVLLIFPVALSAVFVYFVVVPYVIARAAERVARLLKHGDSENVFFVVYGVTWIVLLLVPFVSLFIAVIAAEAER